MAKRLLVLLSLVALVACGDQQLPTGPGKAPSFEIVDGARDPALAHFYFLAPMVWDEPVPTGTFDAAIRPQVVVAVCELGESGCGPEVARFTASGSPFQRVTTSQFTIGGYLFEQYVALWRTDGAGVAVGRTYRATVTAAGLSLGHADVKLVQTKEQAAAVDRSQFTLWVKGLPLPIRFRIETGLVGQLQVAPAEATVAPGATQPFTATATDLHGGPVDAGVSWASSDEAVATVDQQGLATAHATGVAMITATTQRVTAGATLTVQSLDAVALELSGLSDPTEAGAVGAATVTARDPNGNVAGGYRGTITFTSSDPEAMLPADYAFTAADAGVHTFDDALSFKTAGAVTVRVSDVEDETILAEVTVTVSPAAAAELALEGIPDPTTAGVATDVTVTARDAFGNTATGYTGTVQFSSSDPAAALPAAYPFQTGDAGVHTFAGGVTLKTVGPRTIQATDGTLTAHLAVTVDPAAAALLRFTNQPSDALAGAAIAPPVIVTAYDAFDNVATGFTEPVTIAIGANPGAGVLSGTLSPPAALGVAAFGDLSIDHAGAGYTLVVSATGLTGATSDPFDVTAPVPTEVRWVSPVNGLWSDGTRWSTGVAPTADQLVFIDVEGTYTVTLNVNAAVSALTLGATSGIQTLSAGTGRVLSLSTSGTILSTGRMTLTNATVNGPGILTNAAGATISLSQTSTINAALVNAGTLAAGVPPFFSTSTINGPFTTVPGSLVRVHAGGSNAAILTVATGFTNHGTIELTKSSDNNGAAALTVSSGTLVNAADGTIRTLVGSGGGRTLTAQLDNQGTVLLDYVLTINRAGADHFNSGLIDVSGGSLTLTQSGTTPSFTNTGTVTVNPGRTWAISGGSFTQDAGATLGGGGAMTLTNVNPAAFGSALTLGALTLSGSTASFATDISTETMALSLTNATVNGPGILTNAAGATISLSQTSTINAALVNAGTLAAGVPPFFSTSTINGPFTTVPGSLVRVHAGGSNAAILTVANGFTNHGTIELSKALDQFGEARLTVSGGTLLNAPDGTVRSVPGSGGGRVLAAQLDNQGTVILDHVLEVARGSADHTNSGVIQVSGGNLTLTQSGTTPSFSNAGTISLAAGRAWIIAGAAGTFNNDAAGQVTGAGTFQTNAGTALANAGSVTAGLVRIAGALTSASVTGGFAPVTLELIGTTSLIPVGPGFSYTNIRLSTTAPSVSFAGSASLSGSFTVAGTSNLLIGAHEISVGGEFSTANSGLLTMQNAAGVLNVGRAVFGGGSTTNRLTAGVLRVAGDLVQQGAATSFAASGSHLTVLNGTGTQTISFANPGATASRFQRLEHANGSAATVVLGSAAFVNGQLRTPAGMDVARAISSAGFLLTAGGLDAFGLVLDGTPLRVVNGEAITRFDNATFRNLDPAITQFRLDRLADAVTFNNTTFETVPTGAGLYLHLVDTDSGGTLFTVTMQGTTPANHGGRVLESVSGQLLGWPF